jgi:hypothetical protein
VTDVLLLPAVAADTEVAPAPVALAAGFGPLGVLDVNSARGTRGFSMADEGATGLNPATPVAAAASWGAWLMAPKAVLAVVVAGVIVAACELTAGTAARQASAPAAARIEMRFTSPYPPVTRLLSRVM